MGRLVRPEGVLGVGKGVSVGDAAGKELCVGTGGAEGILIGILGVCMPICFDVSCFCSAELVDVALCTGAFCFAGNFPFAREFLVGAGGGCS